MNELNRRVLPEEGGPCATRFFLNGLRTLHLAFVRATEASME